MGHKICFESAMEEINSKDRTTGLHTYLDFEAKAITGTTSGVIKGLAQR